MVISVDAEKPLTEFNIVHDKSPKETGYRSIIPQHNKDGVWQIHCQNHTEWEKLKTLPLKSGMRQGYPLHHSYSMKYCTWNFRAIRREEEIKECT